MTLGLHFFVVHYVWKQRYNYVSLLFAIVKYFLLRDNNVIYLLDVVTNFYDVRIMLFFSTLELRMEITLQLRFVFVRHCDKFFIT